MIYRSIAPDVPVPEVSIARFMLDELAPFGDKPVLIDGPTGRTMTAQQLCDAIRACAAGLAARGFGKGDVLAIASPNLPEYAAAFYGATLAGGTVTTANPAYTADELGRQFGDAGAGWLLTQGAFLPTAGAAAQAVGIEHLITFDGAPGTLPFSDLLQTGGEPPDVPVNPADDVAVLPYSSGTTGMPKGVMITHRNLVASVTSIRNAPDAWMPTPEDVTIAVLPFFHIYGMVVLMTHAVSLGVTVVTLPRFDLEQFLKTLQDYGVTRASLVPPIVVALAKHPAVDKYDLSKLEAIGCGAAPLGADVAEAASRRVGCSVVQGFGLTETASISHTNSEALAAANPGCVGRLVPNTEMRVVDVVTGQDQPPGARGELWLRGPQVMKGYLNNPAATADVLTPDGWFRTGDIGYADETGVTFVVDRLKELIKYKGYQVAPAELEALLLTHPGIADVAVIPSPDEEAGEVPKAFVVTRGADGLTAESVMRWVSERVAPFKRVRRLEFVPQIPKSASGKILRRVLVEQERAAHAG